MRLKVIFFLILAFSQSVFALELKSGMACKSDIEKFCKNETPSEATGWKCLGLNFSSLTPSCTLFMKSYYAASNPCATDIFKHCKGAQANYGQWDDCLKSKTGLAPACEEKMKSITDHEAKRDVMKKACEADFGKYCKGLAPKQQTECTAKASKMKFESFSAGCQEAIKDFTKKI
ncbi:MAG: hypothetical protein K2P81_14765 [Bacteriovoracaceae bacterium]|nr:hypothetical protein [Bacteriovoracaceae bacterium]